VQQAGHGGSPGALTGAACGDGSALALDGGEIPECLERREPGRLGPHARVDQLLGAHVEVELQLSLHVGSDVGGRAGETEEAAHGIGRRQAGEASSAAATARA
jgi:hypothetical protein